MRFVFCRFDHFASTLGLSVTFDSRPPTGVERYDVKLTNGIRASF